MLPRASLPNPHFRSPQDYSPPPPPSTVTTNQYSHQQLPSHQRPFMGIANLSLYSSTVSSMDPASVDFRAFYPYTPNEVKHRKRTTSAQLKILENIFKRDTKPNANLRNELAMQLDMTARGVQVWFQNRRAKEKSKAGKVAVNGKTPTLKSSDDAENANNDAPPPSLDEAETPSDTTTDAEPSPSDSENSEVSKPDQQETAPVVPIPPQLHVLTTSCNDLRQNAFIEPGGHYNDFSSQLLAGRRVSLPVNVYPQPQRSTDGPPHVDFADPLARRRSVDASLHRLVYNPYAHLARAKNGIVFGSRLPGYTSSRYQQRLGIPQSRTGLPYSLEMRRASTDPRFPQSGLSPSPSPLSPAHAMRGPPDHHYSYAISSRTISSPIPGPLPSPGFSFGAATAQSSNSPISAGSERNSPDSFSSYNFRGEDTEDDEGSVSYDAFSRFGSIASVATSDSSINSAYYPDAAGCLPDHEATQDLHSNRRDSCASGHFLGLMSGLDVGSMSRRSDVPANQTTYVSHEAPHATEGTTPGGSNSTSANSEHIAYPSPTSTISPAGGSHEQNLSSSALPTVPISRSSELAFALQSQSEQVALDNQASFPQPPSPPSAPGAHMDSSNNAPNFYLQHAGHLQMLSANTPPSSLDFAEKYQYDPNSIVNSGHYAAYPTLGDGYAAETHNNIAQHMDFNRPQSISEMYSAFADASNNSTTSCPTQGVQSVESYVTFS